MEGFSKMHAFLPSCRDSNISASCLLVVNVGHTETMKFLNQLNLIRFKFYAGSYFVKRVLKETKLKVEDIKSNYFS